MTDIDAYIKYPQHRKWFNKLWLSEKLGYDCGPASIAPSKSGYYISRPIMNLSGMSLNAEKVFIESGDYTKIQPGNFWCSWFDGSQYSISYSRYNGQWQQTHGYQAFRNQQKLYKFDKWVKCNVSRNLPEFFDELSDVDLINVEFIDENIIEVHLRDTPDPTYDELVPIWASEEELIDKYSSLGYTFIQSYDDADGFLEAARIGFMVK